MITWLIEPFQYAFMQRAFLALVLVSISCATIGVYVMLRRMAFIGDALAHSALPGLVVAHFARIDLSLGALIAAVMSALAIGSLSRRDDVREDTAIGIVFTAMFALGLLFMSAERSFRDFTHILFGNIIGVTDTDIVWMAVVAAIVLGGLYLFHKELELTSFDEQYATVIGLRSQRMRFLLLLLLAFAIVAAIQAVGVILTSALLITPPAVAALLTRRLVSMILCSVAVAIFSGVVGLYLSYYYRVSSGAAIVLTCTFCFFAAWLFRRSVRARV